MQIVQKWFTNACAQVSKYRFQILSLFQYSIPPLVSDLLFFVWRQHGKLHEVQGHTIGFIPVLIFFLHNPR